MWSKTWIGGIAALWIGLSAGLAGPGPALERIGPDRAFDFHLQDGWFYYANLEDQQRLYRIRPDGSSRERLSDLPRATLLGFDGPATYFGVFHHENDAAHDFTIDELYRIPAGGAPAKKLAKTSISRGQPGFIAAGNFIYYNGGSPENPSAARLNLSAKKFNALFPAPIQQIVRGPGGSVYLSREGGPGGIERWDPGAKAPVRILSGPVQEFAVKGNWIFFTSARDTAPSELSKTGRLYRIPAGGGAPTLLDAGGSFGLQIAGGWLYFTQGKGGPLCRVRTDGSENETLHDGPVFWPQLSKDWIYFTLGSPLKASGSKLCRVRVDGSDRQVLAKSRARFVAADARGACYMTVDDNTLFRLTPPLPSSGERNRL